jgi:hypothetical protein
MFGIKIVTKKGFEEIREKAERKAIADMVELLLKKDKIFLEPVILFGDNQNVNECVFFGNDKKDPCLELKRLQ